MFFSAENSSTEERSRRGGRDTAMSPAPPARRTSTIATKLAAAATALIVVVTTAVYLQLTKYQRENLLHSKEVASSAVSRLFADWCVAGVVFDDEQAIGDALNTLGRNAEVEYAAVWDVDPAGKVGRRLGQFQRGPAETLAEVAQELRLRRTPDRVVVVAPAINPAGKVVATALVAFSLARENAAIRAVQRTTLIISIAVALGFILVLRWIARVAITRPLAKLVLAAKELEEGGRAQLDVHSSDEVGQLAHAFRNMATAIGVREDRISRASRNMRLVLDSVGQGFITLDVTGTMSPERSKVVDQWFGAADAALPFWEYLGRIDPAAGTWFELGWAAIGEDVLPLELCLEQLPARIQKGEQTFELGYRPVVDGARLERVIVVITDVTARLEHQRTEQAQRDMMSIFRRILADRIALDGFFQEADGLVASLTANTIDDAHELDPFLLRRQLHTLKGNSALFGIESVAQLCHELEDSLSESAKALSPGQSRRLREQWREVTSMYAELARGRAGGSVELERSEYQTFISHLSAAVGGTNPLVEAALRWQFEPASRRLEVAGEQLRGLAERLGKAPVEIVCEPTNLRLPPRKWAPFWSTFSHVIRNAVDHGVETAAERLAAGKPGYATVTLGVAQPGNGEGDANGDRDSVVVTLRDDGRGIDWTRIEERARQHGLPHATQADLEEALFAQGVSTRDAVTSTSGRGVGLAAVRDLVRQLGGRIEVHSEAGRGTTFRCLLPGSMLSDDAATIGNLAARSEGGGAEAPARPSLTRKFLAELGLRNAIGERGA